jgi:hypothetical protein
MSAWPEPSPETVARVRTFVLQGYTGPRRVAELLTAEKWPRPSDTRYEAKKPGKWSEATVARIIEGLDFDVREYPCPNLMAVNAIRRVLHFFDRRPAKIKHEVRMWLYDLKAELVKIGNGKETAGRTIGAQKTNLFGGGA